MHRQRFVFLYSICFRSYDASTERERRWRAEDAPSRESLSRDHTVRDTRRSSKDILKLALQSTFDKLTTHVPVRCIKHPRGTDVGRDARGQGCQGPICIATTVFISVAASHSMLSPDTSCAITESGVLLEEASLSRSSSLRRSGAVPSVAPAKGGDSSAISGSSMMHASGWLRRLKERPAVMPLHLKMMELYLFGGRRAYSRGKRCDRNLDAFLRSSGLSARTSSCPWDAMLVIMTGARMRVVRVCSAIATSVCVLGDALSSGSMVAGTCSIYAVPSTFSSTSGRLVQEPSYSGVSKLNMYNCTWNAILLLVHRRVYIVVDSSLY